MSRSSYKDNLNLLRRTRTSTLNLVVQFTQEQLDYKPATDEWSIGEIIDHIVVVDKYFGSQVAKLIQLKRTGKRPEIHLSIDDLNPTLPFLPERLLRFITPLSRLLAKVVPDRARDNAMVGRPVPVKAPDAFTPTHGKSAAELMDQLRSSLVETTELFEADPELDYDEMILDHPMLGKASAAKEPEALALHEQRHQKQIQQVIRNPGFPACSEPTAKEERAAEMNGQHSISLETRIDLLYDHFKQSRQDLEKHGIWRIRMVIVFAFIVFLMILQISSPDLVARAILKLIGVGLSSEGLDMGGRFTDLTDLTNTALWFSLTCMVIALFARSVYIEQQAAYVGKLEGRLRDLLPDEPIELDPEIKQVNRQFFNKLNFAYQFLTAILLAAVLPMKLITERYKREMDLQSAAYAFVNVVFAFVIVYFCIEAIVWRRNMGKVSASVQVRDR